MSLLTTLIGVKHREELVALQEKLRKATKLLQAKNEIETLDTALEKIIEEFESKGESDEIDDVFDLDYVSPKQTYEIEAEFEFAGRGKPLPFDFSDVNFDDEE